MRSIALVALLAASLLAGCSSNAPKPSATEPSFNDLGLQATSSTGVIRGIVVDDAIHPLSGAAIALTGEGGVARNTTSTAAGTFGFDALAPGTYFMKVHKAGFIDGQQSADVVAGVAEPPIAKVQLRVDAANQPYFEAYVFEGYIECSGTFVAVSFAACSAVNVVSDAAGAGNATQDNFGITYQISKPPAWLQSEMVWSSTQALGGAMVLDYSWGCDTNGGFLCDHGNGGPSPVLVTANATDLQEINGGKLGSGSDGLFMRVFNQGLTETDAGPGGGVGFTLEQRFTVYSHFFYGYTPTEGWRFTSGDPVPSPV